MADRHLANYARTVRRETAKSHRVHAIFYQTLRGILRHGGARFQLPESRRRESGERKGACGGCPAKAAAPCGAHQRALQRSATSKTSTTLTTTRLRRTRVASIPARRAISLTLMKHPMQPLLRAAMMPPSPLRLDLMSRIWMACGLRTALAW